MYLKYPKYVPQGTCRIEWVKFIFYLTKRETLDRERHFLILTMNYSKIPLIQISGDQFNTFELGRFCIRGDYILLF